MGGLTNRSTSTCKIGSVIATTSNLQSHLLAIRQFCFGNLAVSSDGISPPVAGVAACGMVVRTGAEGMSLTNRVTITGRKRFFCIAISENASPTTSVSRTHSLVA